MENRKLTKEDIDKVRDIEGFPIATDEDIIALSDPPYYTACPNPFIEDFIKEHGKPYDEATDDYHREPFAVDVSEGKNDSIYNAHSYHTKVPHKAIMRYILHYTEPGDIVFDGFCGTGMTGVAANICGHPDFEFKYLIEKDMPYIKWGERKAILNDLSPTATFIAYNYNTPINSAELEKETRKILEMCEKECGWMYETKHNVKNKPINFQKQFDESTKMGRINYTIWSDVFICPNCGEEIVYWDVAIDLKAGKVKEFFKCSTCDVNLKKIDCDRAKSITVDKALNETVTLAKQVPVVINYTYERKRFEKKPDSYDLNIIEKIENMDIPYWYPIDELPQGYNTEQPKRSHGIMNVHHFYTKRNLYVLSLLWSKSTGSTKFLVSSFITRNAMKTNRCIVGKYNPTGGIGRPLTGTLYIPSEQIEQSPFDIIKNKLRYFGWDTKNNYVSCSSTTDINIPENSIDYIFIDPPFGGNLMYSELNFLAESWLKVHTCNEKEAIENTVQKKAVKEYQKLMVACFEKFYTVLKPGRWLTVEFHNSKNSIWNSIQESILLSGFIISDVRILNKKHGGIKAAYMINAVNKDLIISAYKPKASFLTEFFAHSGSEQTAWDFIRQHLDKLPVLVAKSGKIEIVVERHAALLFDRMVAFHLVQGIPVSIDAADFYKGLDEKFLKRDGMYFLADQINEYDTARIKSDIEDVQFSLMVTNEKTAVAWLYQQLVKARTYADIQPIFMQEVRSIEKYEKIPELAVLLEENFLQDEEGKWYIPDFTKATDVIKLREKRLVKEFEEYLNTKGKLKLFRAEAVRAGFAKLWKDKNYELIVKTAERLPESVIQEDDKLLMYYDISLGRLG